MTPPNVVILNEAKEPELFEAADHTARMKLRLLLFHSG
jgi:hypothetical protein